MFGPVEQGDWLHACGIRERSSYLMDALNLNLSPFIVYDG